MSHRWTHGVWGQCKDWHWEGWEPLDGVRAEEDHVLTYIFRVLLWPLVDKQLFVGKGKHRESGYAVITICLARDDSGSDKCGCSAAVTSGSLGPPVPCTITGLPESRELLQGLEWSRQISLFFQGFIFPIYEMMPDSNICLTKLTRFLRELNEIITWKAWSKAGSKTHMTQNPPAR